MICDISLTHQKTITSITTLLIAHFWKKTLVRLTNRRVNYSLIKMWTSISCFRNYISVISRVTNTEYTILHQPGKSQLSHKWRYNICGGFKFAHLPLPEKCKNSITANIHDFTVFYILFDFLDRNPVSINWDNDNKQTLSC
jgi:hypothetical protein